MEKEYKIIKNHPNHKKGDVVKLTEELHGIFLKLGLIEGSKKTK